MSGPARWTSSPHSIWPSLTAAGAALLALGVVFGLWLFLIGMGVALAGVFGMVFQYARVQG